MKLGKKLGFGLAATALTLSLATGAFASENNDTSDLTVEENNPTILALDGATPRYGADTDSTPAAGYGTLNANNWTTGSNGGLETYVTSNPDRAYLVANYTIQDKNGKNLASDQTSSERGKTHHTASNNPSSSAYVIHGTHGVQGGSTYAAKAVYTAVFIK